LQEGGGKFEEDSSAGFIGILVAAVAEDHDAELPTWHHPDIGRGVVEAAVFFDDGRLPVRDLPGQRLRVAGADAKDTTVRQRRRVMQRLVQRQFVEIGGERREVDLDGATARRALANGDGSEVQLLGDARINRPATGKDEAVEFRSEFLHAFRNVEQVRSHLPVVMTQGTDIIHAASMNYDNLARLVEFKGRASASFAPKKRGG